MCETWKPCILGLRGTILPGCYLALDFGFSTHSFSDESACQALCEIEDANVPQAFWWSGAPTCQHANMLVPWQEELIGFSLTIMDAFGDDLR